ncbi:Uncharacterised protein [Streptococcus pneumoniae]|nr:Uncharacterised protein [Streptococcus pneumoniae]VIU35684.1 Uncharacterised protein [Streptococcus pneumoniae]VJH88425.1 Uncharacterised protein [Streptococcus pneumoniae]VJS37419.1 Uncharacterised protein [Streptococcus pneumoniae]VKB96760.1 Uncharacterised protein [Streptococcus pneumoniae]
MRRGISMRDLIFLKAQNRIVEPKEVEVLT